jgi:spore germination protein
VHSEMPATGRRGPGHSGAGRPEAPGPGGPAVSGAGGQPAPARPVSGPRLTAVPGRGGQRASGPRLTAVPGRGGQPASGPRPTAVPGPRRRTVTSARGAGPVVRIAGPAAGKTGSAAGSGTGPPRRMTPPWGQRAGYAWLFFVALGALGVVILTLLPNFGPAAIHRRTVVASLPYWNMPLGAATVLANRNAFTEVSPWMYGLSPSGQIVPQYPAGQAAAMATNLQKLRAARLPIVPTLANITGGDFVYQPAARILHSPSLARAQVAAIAQLVRQQGFAGIDIDYEELHGTDRAAFSSFITSLGAALHAEGKILSVAVFAKTTDAGYDQRNVAQGYAAIGRAADQVRLMAYDYHWATSQPGPVAPIWWVRDVIRYAKTQIPAKKIILGVPLYGYDWSGGRGTTVTWLQAFQLATKHKARSRFDAASQEPWFTYTDRSGRKHQVWFENAQSSTAKFAAAQGSGIGGAYLWMYGYEESSTWPALRNTLPADTQPASSAAPQRSRAGS